MAKPELLSRRKFNGEIYKLITKHGKKVWADEQACKWRDKGYKARVVKVSSEGWKWAVYIRKAK